MQILEKKRKKQAKRSKNKQIGTKLAKMEQNQPKLNKIRQKGTQFRQQKVQKNFGEKLQSFHANMKRIFKGPKISYA